MKTKFSYLTVLSVVSGRNISIDGSSTEFDALVYYLTLLNPDNTNSERVLSLARELLYRYFPCVAPSALGSQHDELLKALVGHIDGVGEAELPVWLCVWAAKTKIEFVLPEVFDFGTRGMEMFAEYIKVISIPSEGDSDHFINPGMADRERPFERYLERLPYPGHRPNFLIGDENIQMPITTLDPDPDFHRHFQKSIIGPFSIKLDLKKYMPPPSDKGE